jgi:hypothetical protein
MLTPASESAGNEGLCFTAGVKAGVFGCGVINAQMLKQLVSRRLQQDDHPFWQPRYYDFNVFTQQKWREKLRYLHLNPVTRGLVAAPEDWPWSSYRHWLTGERGTVEIESHWTFKARQKMGIDPVFLNQPI